MNCLNICFYKKAQLSLTNRATGCNVIVAPSGGTPSNINEIYSSMKSIFSGLQFCRWQYGPISIRLAVVAFQMYEIARNSKKIRTYCYTFIKFISLFARVDSIAELNSSCDAVSGSPQRMSYPLHTSNVSTVAEML